MISTATILACIVTLFVSLILPLLGLLVYGLRNRGQGVWSAWLLGAAGFFVPQILIRSPILGALAANTGFVSFAQLHPWVYGFSLALTAALFEAAGRLGAALLMKKRLISRRALAAGMGHGGIEAILIVGLTYINNLVYIFLIQTGGFDALVSQAAASGADTSQLLAIRESFLNLAPGIFLLAGFERLLTMVCQAAMSVMVCYGVYKKRPLPWLLACLGVHTFLDSSACIRNLTGKGLSQAAVYGIIYLLITAAAVVCTVVLVRILRSWRAEECEKAIPETGC
ncbi:MAG: YhfC family glutamic-type intramembrane protease [Candidatus Faecousia sp.]|nr:YhfC family intramembrane metalloprotease [Clostridiales bacterium]MDY6181079.1 YhfC family glutamic-type intramembrane protease [Candidatus Faecousia sp.]